MIGVFLNLVICKIVDYNSFFEVAAIAVFNHYMLSLLLVYVCVAVVAIAIFILKTTFANFFICIMDRSNDSYEIG